MEEINKRFGIIEAAIDLSDYEVIDLQISHLRNLSTDKGLHDILRDLESKNFRQALFEMRNYSVTVKDDFFEDTASKEETVETSDTPSEEEANLFSAALEDNSEERVVSLNEMLEMTKENASSPRDYAMDAQSSVEDATPAQEEVPKPVNLEDDPLFALDQFVEPEENAGTTYIEKQAEELIEDADDIEQADSMEQANVEPEDHKMTPLFTDEVLSEEEQEVEHHYSDSEVPSGEAITEDESYEVAAAAALSAASAYRVTDADTDDSETDFTSQETFSQTQSESKTPKVWDFEPDEDDKLYKNFVYMDQKFRNMLHQHPQREELEDGICVEVSDFIEFVSSHDYAESHIESVIARYQELKDQGNKAEAAQMLIAAATTESTFAQFMLARELFRGDVLQQNYPDAFTQINQLAEEDYPEAICDLGQLYEYGIGIDKNKQHAMLLYEEAAEMGVERAQKHFERLKSASPIGSLKSITSSFLKKKKG
jgi:hypothetical protein